jgi:2-polyprenyl-3-methyl-5-hydroxy-6-metoxy-1,4-benzoquinol methylase
LGDFLESDPKQCYDVILLIDVLEHLENPFSMLRGILTRANLFVFHIPLNLHALGALRNSSLKRARNLTSHLHYWNKDLALAMLEGCGLEIINWEYIASAVEIPTRLWARKLMRHPRRLLFFLAPQLTFRLLGGYFLMVLAQARKDHQPHD